MGQFFGIVLAQPSGLNSQEADIYTDPKFRFKMGSAGQQQMPRSCRRGNENLGKSELPADALQIISSWLG
jgi:hypothetical protein